MQSRHNGLRFSFRTYVVLGHVPYFLWLVNKHPHMHLYTRRVHTNTHGLFETLYQYYETLSCDITCT